MKIAGFYENSCTNGDGWRSVLFVSGCPHHCLGCHNQQTWDYEFGEEVDNIDNIVSNILKNKKLIDGLTISGGEPFQYRNIEPLIYIIDKIRKEGLNIWCYSGYTFEFLKEDKEFSKLLNKIDILVDGPFIKSLFSPNIKFRGSTNQRIIDVKKSFNNNEICEVEY